MVHFGPLIDTTPATLPAPSVDEITREIEDALTRGAQRAEAAVEHD